MVKAVNGGVDLVGEKEQLEKELCDIIRSYLRSQHFRTSEIVATISTGFAMEGKISRFLEYSNLLKDFPFDDVKFKEGE